MSNQSETTPDPWRPATKEETDAAYRKILWEAVGKNPFKPVRVPHDN